MDINKQGSLMIDNLVNKDKISEKNAKKTVLFEMNAAYKKSWNFIM